MWNWLWVVMLLVIVAAVIYWLLVITEGVYLGRSVVVWLYDRFAPQYDAVKQYTVEDESILVVEPVLACIRRPNVCVLDVATGTGRVPQFLHGDERFVGRVVGIDASRAMLHQAVANVQPYQPVTDLICGEASALPLPAAHFDVVTCLESLEFFPSETAALREIVRVLRPGGYLLITRRIGWEARFFFGRFRTPAAFEARLHDLGLDDATTYPWQSNYDLVIAYKPLAKRGETHAAID